MATPSGAIMGTPPSHSLICVVMHVHLLLCMLCLLVRVYDQVAPLALPRGVGLDALVLLPALKTACGPGVGMAV